MFIRHGTAADIPRVLEMWKEHHAPAFQITLPFFVVIEMVGDVENVIGFGTFRTFIEATAITDQTIEKRKIVEAIRLLAHQSLFEAKKHGHKYIYAFAKNSSFGQILRRHFGYQPCYGEALFVEIPDQR